jgi:hypothetical protein
MTYSSLMKPSLPLYRCRRNSESTTDQKKAVDSSRALFLASEEFTRCSATLLGPANHVRTCILQISWSRGGLTSESKPQMMSRALGPQKGNTRSVFARTRQRLLSTGLRWHILLSHVFVLDSFVLVITMRSILE